MAKQFPAILDDHRQFIESQHMFFVGTAVAEGRVNISPKGMDSLRVMSENRVVWRNLTGSGNETDGHVQIDPRMTLMFVSFEKRPMILRLYGNARVIHHRDADWPDLNALFPASVGARQIFDVEIDLVQTSCGFSIPFFDYAGERDTLAKWAEAKGEDGVHDYWRDRNGATIDGIPTGTAQSNLGEPV